MSSLIFPQSDSSWQEPVSRRTLLKYLAASIALSGVNACTRAPEEHIVPYVEMPEHRVPGKPVFFASCATLGGYAQGILVETYEGRPIKIEGNPQHPASLGATDVFTQAILLGLYDPDRSQAVMWNNQISHLNQFLAALDRKREQLMMQNGKGLCLLTGSLSAPSQLAAITQLKTSFPLARWFTHDTASRSQVYQGAQLAFGKPMETLYHFDKAEVVVSLDADCFGEQPGKLRYAHDFMQRRRVRDQSGLLNRLYVFESTPTITGATADYRFPVRASEIEALVRTIAFRLGISIAQPELSFQMPEAWITSTVQALKSHRGRCLVVTGDHHPATVHAIVHAINHHLDNQNKTISYIQPVLTLPEGNLTDLAQAIEQKEVDTLIMLEVNPAYTAPANIDFSALLKTVPFNAQLSLYRDETSLVTQWHLPAVHELESWSDARAYDGLVSIVQPMIAPLYNGLHPRQLLAALIGEQTQTAHDLLKNHWRDHWRESFHRQNAQEVAFERQWKQWLQQGWVNDTAFPAQQVHLRAHWQTEIAPPPARSNANGLEIQFRLDPCVWDGRFANNGWLQELPKPLTKLTWGNAALISPRLAEGLNVTNGDVILLRVNGHELQTPVWIQPGQPKESVTLHLGHGRPTAGRLGSNVGVNAYLIKPGEMLAYTDRITLSVTGRKEPLATTQHHHSMEGLDLLRKVDLSYLNNDAVSAHPAQLLADEDESHAWGMVIDLNACIGCNACVIACQAENNIPVVGKEEVLRGHELHWLRVDRYYSGAPETPAIDFQPVPCMHCETAPCEYVCPVEATQHSPEGLNEMIYNRCIGTRYCSQNCPYKVRRFNWFNYSRQKYATPAPAYNPDVTVRSRGVMEKCTYCIQRINQVKIEARRENRPIEDGEIKTACQSVCPTQAIIFGDIRDRTSTVARLKTHVLNYQMLGELNTRPRTSYLAKVVVSKAVEIENI